MNNLADDLLDEIIDAFVSNRALTATTLYSEGGGYMSYIPHYGHSLVGDGETKKESLEDLKSLIKWRLTRDK